MANVIGPFRSSEGLSQTAVWDSTDSPPGTPMPIRWVRIRDPRGHFATQLVDRQHFSSIAVRPSPRESAARSSTT